MKREGTSVMRLTWWSLKGCQRLSDWQQSANCLVTTAQWCFLSPDLVLSLMSLLSEHQIIGLITENARYTRTTPHCRGEHKATLRICRWSWKRFISAETRSNPRDPLQSTCSEPYWWTNSPPALLLIRLLRVQGTNWTWEWKGGMGILLHIPHEMKWNLNLITTIFGDSKMLFQPLAFSHNRSKTNRTRLWQC